MAAGAPGALDVGIAADEEGDVQADDEAVAGFGEADGELAFELMSEEGEAGFDAR